MGDIPNVMWRAANTGMQLLNHWRHLDSRHSRLAESAAWYNHFENYSTRGSLSSPTVLFFLFFPENGTFSSIVLIGYLIFLFSCFQVEW
jgi:hypothetical protein